MYMKTCSHCGDNSYSASKIGRWSCSRCGQDLTNEQAKTPFNQGGKKPA